MKKLLTFGYLLILSHQVWAYPYSNIYVFGDSLSDTGRLFEVIGIPAEPYFEGRSSNGKVWVEYLSEKLNLTYNPQTNYAWSGATTGTTNIWSEFFPDAELWGMQQQIDHYLENNTSADPNGLYIVWGGGNDFMGKLTGHQELITAGITNIVTTVGKLRQHGVQHLVVMNMPDLGKTPRVVASGYSAAMTELTMAFNQVLAENLQPFNVIQVDLPAISTMLSDTETFLNPVTLGINNFTDMCFDSSTGTVCQTHNFFWDDIHPTTKVHLALASILYSAVAKPVYIDDVRSQAILSLPIIKMNETVILDTEMVRDFDNTKFSIAVTDSKLHTTKFQDIFTFPNEPQYPSYDESTGELHLPIVLYVQKEYVVCVTTPCDPIFNYLTQYTVDLNLVPVVNPFSTPLFVLNHIDLLTSF